MRYLTLSELIYINGRLLDNPKLLSGKQEVRDLALLDAAATRPAASAFGQDAFPTLAEKAAALLHAIARNHPFTDGNKRTATLAALLMLRFNGQRVNWQAAEALEIIVAVAENRWTLEQLAAWWPLAPAETYPEPETERDIALIEDLMQAHHWLLNELKSR